MNIMILVLSVLSFIFFLSVHSDMLFKYVWVFRFSDAMFPLLVGIYVGTLNFELKLEMPIERRLAISNAGKSSTNYNLSSGSMSAGGRMLKKSTRGFSIEVKAIGA